jgi:hypothetical protein
MDIDKKIHIHFDPRIERKIGNVLDALEAYVRSQIYDPTAVKLEVSGKVVDKSVPPTTKG